MGTYAIEMVVDTIVKTSLALASGKYDKFPSLDWAQGITTSLIGFGLPMMILGLALPLIVAGALSVMAIVETLSLVDEILSDGNFTKYPSDDWANGVSKSVQMFSAMVNSIDVDLGNLLSLWAITKAMDNFSEKMFDIQTNYGEIFNNGGVAQNIAKSIQALVTAMPKQSDVDPIYSLITALNALANVEWDNLLNIAPMSSMIGQLASQIDLINESKVESLAKLGAGLHIISLVDETRLKSTLDAIQSKSNALSQIMDEHSVISGVFDRAKNQISGKENNQPTTVKKPGQQEEISSFEEQMLNYIKNIDTNIGKMANVTKEEREEAIKGKDVEDDGGWFSGWF